MIAITRFVRAHAPSPSSRRFTSSSFAIRWSTPRPYINLTPTLLGQGNGPKRVGEHVGVVNLQHTLEVTRDGKQAKAALREELYRKQDELDRLQRAVKEKYAANLKAAQGSPELEAMKQRDLELKRELEQHEREATKAILRKLSPRSPSWRSITGSTSSSRPPTRAKEVLYRDGVDYPPRGPDLTDELIRLHDERSR